MANETDRARAAEEPFQRAVEAHEQGRLEQAEQLYRAVLGGEPEHLGALHNLAILCFQRGEYSTAATLTYQVVRQRPDLATAYNTLGLALRHLGHLAEAESCCREALRLAPEYWEAHNSLGDVLVVLGRYDEAEASFRQALRLAPQYIEALNNLSSVLTLSGRGDEAEAFCREAQRLAPTNAAGYRNLGTIELGRGHLDEAESCYREALRLNPGDGTAQNNLGTVLIALNRLDEAEICYREALRLNPADAAARANLGAALDLQGRLGEAVAEYERAAALKPDDLATVEIWYCKKRTICDWTSYVEDEAKFRHALLAEPLPSVAFRLLSLPTSPAEQLAYARRIAATLEVPEPERLVNSRPAPSRRVRLGYLLLEHPTGHLVAGVLRHHERRKFEVIVYCASVDKGAAVRRRIEQAVDRFVDISEMPEADAARLIHNDQIDILVDLIGFKPSVKSKIPAYRPAPIQVNYLGYPGTMGADYIDYMIVDRFVVPPDQQQFYDEHLVYLPHCYQCNDDEREIAAYTPTRAECGLPEQGFVFCCFNDTYKYTPDVFDIWMRLLHAVPESVLWLLEAAPGVSDNLRREANARGIASDRLVSAPRLSLPEHFARHRLADLFLDTLPYNAHVTASDALWAGLPVVTCAGTTFASRVAGSLLQAIGLDELVTTSLEDYECLVLRLASDYGLRTGLRRRLAENRQTFPLFDTARSTRYLEAAYIRICEMRQTGQPPTSFSVPRSGGN